MNTTDLWFQLQELEQEVRDAKSEASRSEYLLQAELDLIKAKVQVGYLAQNQRLKALAKRIGTLRGMVGIKADLERQLASRSPETPTQAVAPSEDTLGGGQA